MIYITLITDISVPVYLDLTELITQQKNWQDIIQINRKLNRLEKNNATAGWISCVSSTGAVRYAVNCILPRQRITTAINSDIILINAVPVDCREDWIISLRQKQKKLIMLPSETMIWQPEFTDKTLSRISGAVN
ncbi:hypothetical protein ABOB24_25985 [Escherichia coli]